MQGRERLGGLRELGVGRRVWDEHCLDEGGHGAPTADAAAVIVVGPDGWSANAFLWSVG